MGQAAAGFPGGARGLAPQTGRGEVLSIGQAALTPVGDWPMMGQAARPISQAEALGGVVLDLLARGGHRAEQVKDLLRSTVGVAGQAGLTPGEPTISIFESAKRSPTKSPLALSDDLSTSRDTGQHVSPAGSASSGSGGSLVAPTGSGGSSGQAAPPSGQAVPPSGRNLLGALDMVARDAGTVAVPQVPASQGLGSFLDQTKAMVLKRKIPADGDAEEDCESEAPADKADAKTGRRRRPSAATKAKAKGKAKADAKGKAVPAEAKDQIKDPVVRKNLEFPGTTKKVKVFIGKCTIYTDLKAKMWRLKSGKGKEGRLTPSYSWKVEPAEKVWRRLAADVREINRN